MSKKIPELCKSILSTTALVYLFFSFLYKLAAGRTALDLVSLILLGVLLVDYIQKSQKCDEYVKASIAMKKMQDKLSELGYLTICGVNYDTFKIEPSEKYELECFNKGANHEVQE